MQRIDLAGVAPPPLPLEPRLRLARPRTVMEASNALAHHGDSAVVYAGGVETLMLIRLGRINPRILVDIKRVDHLRDITYKRGTVIIGATATHREVETNPVIRRRLPLLRTAESLVGNIRVRTTGTIGGNLCNGHPHTDAGTALLIHDATLSLVSSAGERDVPLENFYLGQYQVALNRGELLTAIRLRPLSKEWRYAYVHIERHHRPPTALVAVAAKEADGRVKAVRMVVGAVGVKPTRLRYMEQAIRDITLKEAGRVIATEGEYLNKALEPEDDLLGSVSYKLHLTQVLLTRALHGAVYDEATK
jgi:carbon-monoxide dehydrogenase medium subunit